VDIYHSCPTKINIQPITCQKEAILIYIYNFISNNLRDQTLAKKWKFKLSGSNNYLILIPVPSLGYSVPYLRDHSGLGQALAYIRPLQARLDLSPAEVDQIERPQPEELPGSSREMKRPQPEELPGSSRSREMK
jgi:hypothetical protein